jgi:hypothetical protein
MVEERARRMQRHQAKGRMQALFVRPVPAHEGGAQGWNMASIDGTAAFAAFTRGY